LFSAAEFVGEDHGPGKAIVAEQGLDGDLGGAGGGARGGDGVVQLRGDELEELALDDEVEGEPLRVGGVGDVIRNLVDGEFHLEPISPERI
jgi:hypothetical protein